jgi:hypothetical protein
MEVTRGKRLTLNELEGISGGLTVATTTTGSNDLNIAMPTGSLAQLTGNAVLDTGAIHITQAVPPPPVSNAPAPIDVSGALSGLHPSANYSNEVNQNILAANPIHSVQLVPHITGPAVDIQAPQPIGAHSAIGSASTSAASY